MYLEKLVGVEDIELFTLLQFDFALVSLALCPGPFLYSKKVFHLFLILQEPTVERLIKSLGVVGIQDGQRSLAEGLGY